MNVPVDVTAMVMPSLKLYLGPASKFAVLAGSTVTFGSLPTVIADGSVGSLSPSVDSISGKYMLLAGSPEPGTDVATRGMAAYDILNKAASGTICTANPSTGSLSGVTLLPGVYCFSALSLSLDAWKSLTLDGKNVSTSLWVLKSKEALVTGAHSSMILTNGALASNVFWSLGTSATLGASSYFVGQILALTEIVVGTQCVLNGRGFTKTSVTFAGGSLVSLASTYGNSNVTMGSNCKNFAVLAGTYVSFGTERSVIASGSVGVSPGTDINGNFTLLNGTIESYTSTSIFAANELTMMYNAASTLVCRNFLPTKKLSKLTLSQACTAHQVVCSLWVRRAL